MLLSREPLLRKFWLKIVRNLITSLTWGARPSGSSVFTSPKTPIENRVGGQRRAEGEERGRRLGQLGSPVPGTAEQPALWPQP